MSAGGQSPQSEWGTGVWGQEGDVWIIRLQKHGGRITECMKVLSTWKRTYDRVIGKLYSRYDLGGKQLNPISMLIA